LKFFKKFFLSVFFPIIGAPDGLTLSTKLLTYDNGIPFPVGKLFGALLLTLESPDCFASDIIPLSFLLSANN